MVLYAIVIGEFYISLKESPPVMWHRKAELFTRVTYGKIVRVGLNSFYFLKLSFVGKVAHTCHVVQICRIL